MAGTPVKAEKMARLDAAEAEIFDRLEAGDSLAKICALHDVGIRLLRAWLNKTEERSTAYAHARERAADAKAEGTADAAAGLLFRAREGLADQVEVSATKLAIESDRWLAGVWNRERYGERQQAGVTVNLVGLHLDALRRPETVVLPVPEPVAAIPAPGADREPEPTTAQLPLSLDDLI